MKISSQIQRFTTVAPSLFDQYLANTQTKIRIVSQKTRGRRKAQNFDEKVIVPRMGAEKSSYASHFSQKWKNKTLIFDIDPSTSIGTKRLFMKQDLVKNVYKGISEPADFLTKQNPDHQKIIQQLYFSPELFFMTDRKLPKLLDQEEMKEEICLLYERQPNRLFKRLKQEYRVPTQYLEIVEMAILNENKIVFGGLNEYVFRNLIGRLYTLAQLRKIYYSALKYCFSVSEDMEKIHQLSREHIYHKTYPFIQKIQNFKFNSLAKLFKNSVIFGPSYMIESLHEREKVTGTRQSRQDPEADEQRIEKQAILESLLGPLWLLPYSLNKFSYLTQPYEKLSEEDKMLVQEMFEEKLVKYKGGIKTFYLKNRAEG